MRATVTTGADGWSFSTTVDTEDPKEAAESAAEEAAETWAGHYLDLPPLLAFRVLAGGRLFHVEVTCCMVPDFTATRCQEVA